MRIWTYPMLLGALLVLVSGCGDKATKPADEPKEPASQSTSSSRTPAPKPGMTAPGAELALGRTATVPVRSFKDPIGGTAEITVVSIEKVPQDEVDSSGYAPENDAAVYLIRSKARLTKVTDLRIFDPAVDLVPYTSEGALNPELSPEDAELFGCEADADGSPQAGSQLTLCGAVAVPDGAEVDHVLFAPYVGDYSIREGAPITWR